MMIQPMLWAAPPPLLTLSSADVHVWRATLDRPAAEIHGLEQILSADERARADAFYFAHDRVRFVAGRGLLRLILSHYTGITPQQLRFCYGTRGKPELIQSPDEALSFNVSHSGGVGLYALTQRRAIGVDIEHVRSLPNAEQMARRYFSPLEYSALQTLTPRDHLRGFFRCWTRKEAYIKARGDGLAHPLDRFAVSLAPHEPARLVQTLDDPHERTRWSLHALSPGVGFVGALAVEGHGWRLRCWHYPDE